MKVPLALNLTEVGSLSGLHEAMAKIFGFPEFYGNNYPGLVDCLSSLRYPADGMTSVNLKSNCDAIELRIIGLSSCKYEVVVTLLSAIESVNDRLIQRSMNPSIYLLLVKEGLRE